MGRVTERFDVFPFLEPARKLLRDEQALLSPAVPPPMGIRWDPVPPLRVIHFDQEFEDKKFSPPQILWEGDSGRIEWQQMDFRQPMYHRNLDVDEMSFQIYGPRTLMTEIGTVELLPGDLVRIPVGVAHDNWGRRASHILWYFPSPITEVGDVLRRSEVLVPPFEGWQPEMVNEVHTNCLGGRPVSVRTGPQHCDTAVQLSDETLLLEQGHSETERLQVLHPEPSGNETDWVWQGPDHWIGLTSVTDSDGRTYTRHRNVDEVQYQVTGTRLLISANGVVELTPGTFVHLPVGVAYASIVAGTSTHVTTLCRGALECVYDKAAESASWTPEEIDAYRERVASVPAGV